MDSMRILITGASGLIGQALVSKLESNYQITVLGRDVNKLKKLFPKVHAYLTWRDLDNHNLADYDWLINLAGENIGEKRWTAKRKQALLESRVSTTTKLAKLCAACADKSPKIINASAVSIYPVAESLAQQNSLVFDDDAPAVQAPKNLLGQISVAWEASLQAAIAASIPVYFIRLPMVLAKQGGALAKLLPSFKLGGGAILGSGEQPVSWVALPDVIHAIEFIIEQTPAVGAYNVVADEVVSQAQFSKTLAQILNRPCFMRMPSMVVKLMFADMADELLLSGQKVKSSKLRAAGFNFEFDQLELAFKSIL